MNTKLVRASRLSNEICFCPNSFTILACHRIIISYLDFFGTEKSVTLTASQLHEFNYKFPYPPLSLEWPRVVVTLIGENIENQYLIDCLNWSLCFERFSGGIATGWVAVSSKMAAIRPFNLFLGDQELSYNIRIANSRSDVISFYKAYSFNAFNFELTSSRNLADSVHPLRASYLSKEHSFVEATVITASWRDILQRSLVHKPSHNANKLSSRQEDTLPNKARIAILMPIYGGVKETVSALNSLSQYFESSPQLHVRFILGLDNPADTQMTSAIINGFGSIGNVRIVQNQVNLGFVGNCNSMFSLVEPDEDILLINSDVIAPSSSWIERLVDFAAGDDSIGSITPLSNQASIFSFPIPNQECQGLPLGLNVDDIDDALRSTDISSERDYLEVPSCHGFCTLILNSRLRLGCLFDVAFGKGYAEENDLSMRIRSKGFKNVCYPAVFVFHHESISFSGDKSKLLEVNLKTLGQKYPSYHEAVRNYCIADPLRHFRLRALFNLLRSHHRKLGNEYVFHVCHNRGGGTHAFIAGYVRDNPGSSHLLLTPHGSGQLELSSVESFKGSLVKHKITLFYVDDFLANIQSFRDAGVSLVIIHSIIDFHEFGALDLFKELLRSFRSIVYIHDYHWICINENMLNQRHQCIGSSACDIIYDLARLAGVRTDSLAFLLANHEHAKRMKELLICAQEIIAPSDCSAQIVCKTAGIDTRNISVLYHDESTQYASSSSWPILRSPRDSPINVAVIGAIGWNKGFSKLVELARHICSSREPLRIIVIGNTLNNSLLKSFECVSIAGKYDEADFPRLVRHYLIDCALFLSPWPETYSYTLSLAFKEKVWPFVLDHGAPSERVKRSGFGSVLKSHEVIALCDQIKKIRDYALDAP